MNGFATFKTINEEIRTTLGKIEEHIAAHPYFDGNDDVSENNEAFIELLDKLLEARSMIEELKNNTVS